MMSHHSTQSLLRNKNNSKIPKHWFPGRNISVVDLKQLSHYCNLENSLTHCAQALCARVTNIKHFKLYVVMYKYFCIKQLSSKKSPEVAEFQNKIILKISHFWRIQ
jgi:hypothetical protein